MKGIRSYAHAERERVIAELIPLIERKFGENLVALAASASFARGEDTDYSDLELTAFDALLDMVVQGHYQDLAALRTTVENVFSQFEEIFEALGVELYDRSIDPNTA